MALDCHFFRASFSVVTIFITLSLSSVSKASDCLTASPWQGTIGNIPITLEFPRTNDLTVGRYYYRNNLNDLILKLNESMTGWTEYTNKNEVSGTIENFNCEDDLFTAEWKSVDGQITLPLKATRIKDYSKKRLEIIQFTATPKNLNQHQYHVLSVPDIKSTGLRLIGKSKGIQEINSTLQKSFIDDIDGEITCLSWGRMSDQGNVSETNYAVIEWNSKFVVIRATINEDCGGVHPNSGSDVRVFGLTTGKLEDVSLWLNQDLQQGPEVIKEISEGSALDKKLRKQYVTQWKKYAKSKEDVEQGKSCLKEISFFSTGSWATSSGMVFRADASHEASACIEEVILPFKEVAPFLSERGKLAIRAFIK